MATVKHFTLVNVQELPSGAFYADIKQGSKKVGSVENAGRGGSDSFYFHDIAVEREFKAKSEEFFPDGYEPMDQYATRLAFEADLNKLRKKIGAVTDVDAFYEDGSFKTFGSPNASVPLEDVLKSVKTTYPDYFIWVKASQEFVRAGDLNL